MRPPDLSPLWISLRVSLLATLISGSVGILLAYRLYRRPGRHPALVDTLLLSPLLLPPTVVGLLLLLLFGRQGLLGPWLYRLGLPLVFTWQAAVAASAVVAFPLVYRAARGAFEQLDPLLLDAARLDGASEADVLLHIALPLARPGLLAGLLLAYARALGEFGATLMVAGNIPGQTQTIPLAIYLATETGAIGEAVFWALVAIALGLGGALLLGRWLGRSPL